MKRSIHSLIGSFVAVAIYGSYKYFKKEKPTLKGTLASIIIGNLAGQLPDILEPATNPNHRSFFHSKFLLGILSLVNVKVWQNSEIDNQIKMGIFAISSAYGSHLLTDATTKKGLPIL